MKRLLQLCSVALVVLAIPLFSGCTGYVYNGGVGVGVGLGGGWSGGGWGHGGGWYRGGRGGGYGGGYGRGGGWGRGGRGGGYYGGRHVMSADDFSVEDIAESDSLVEASIMSAVSADSAVMLARDYEISVDSAQKILKIASGKISKQSLRAVGLTAQDAKLIKKLEVPSDETISRISYALGEETWKIQRLVQGFVSDLERQ